jgi:hypothetical protein
MFLTPKAEAGERNFKYNISANYSYSNLFPDNDVDDDVNKSVNGFSVNSGIIMDNNWGFEFSYKYGKGGTKSKKEGGNILKIRIDYEAFTFDVQYYFDISKNNSLKLFVLGGLGIYNTEIDSKSSGGDNEIDKESELAPTIGGGFLFKNAHNPFFTKVSVEYSNVEADDNCLNGLLSFNLGVGFEF